MKTKLRLSLIIFFTLVLFSTSGFANEDYFNTVILIKADKDLASISNTIKKVHFDFESLNTLDLSETVKDNALISHIFDFNGEELNKNFILESSLFFSANLKTLFLKYQPEYIERIFSPPFETTQYNHQGEQVKVPDLSIHYRIKLCNQNKQLDFIRDLNQLKNKEIAFLPPTPAQTSNDGDVPPNDSNFSQQWYLKKSETYSINAEEAWEIANDNTSILIHINEYHIDGSFSSINHNDLNNNIFYQELLDGPTWSHLNEVCGVASAVTNNSNCLAGVAYNSKLWATTADLTSERADQLKTASDNGARIANFSWNIETNVSALEDAVEYAFNKGVFMVASGGNTGARSTTRYPGNYDSYVMSVSAIAQNGTQPDWVTWGPHIDVTAPGDNILLVSGQPNSTRTWHGTSYSSPMVAGIAALLLSKNSNLSPTQVRTIIEESAIHMGDSGKNENYGWGRVDAFDALLSVPEIFPTIQSAINAASPGAIVHVRGTNTISSNVVVPAGVTLTFESGTTLNFSGTSYITVNDSGAIYAEGPVTFSPSDRRIVFTGGELIMDNQWGFPVTISDNLTVNSGKTLTVLPGSNIKTASGKKLTVNGWLIAQGSHTSPITFQSVSGYWYGIDAVDGYVQLEYCYVQNGGVKSFV